MGRQHESGPGSLAFAVSKLNLPCELMSEARTSLPLWPFIIVDVLFAGLAAILLKFGHHPLTGGEAALMVVCGMIGSASFLLPFLRRNADEQTLSQFKLLADAASQIQKLDQLAAHISGATNQWLELQTQTGKAAESVKQVAAGMASEAKSFTEFMQRAGESEKAHLRLEVEKLRRSEGERLQVITHILDHVFALSQAARKSGQPGLIEQISHFQNACREAGRRVGLIQIVPPTNEPFDPKQHQLSEGKTAGESATIEDTIIAGYTYQGQLLRRPVVALKE